MIKVPCKKKMFCILIRSENQIEVTQTLGIHDVLNAQGFAMHYRAISSRDSHFEVFRCERESLPLVCLRMIKRGDPVVDQKIVGLFY